ncbi:MAG: SDR family NAD(P)-dependent oxidoreductase [Steroidobacteraceae bacterium]|nr:SDR family NAD(P)-dependent oxidoreductase [Steroidobacteraceae bacterium]
MAIVTGAARGIGLAVASAMGEAGARVVLADVTTDGLDAACSQLRARGIEALGVTANVADPDDNVRLVAQAVERYGRVDVFHANAAIVSFADLLETSARQIGDALAVNLEGAIHGCRAVLPVMQRQRGGVILLTASVAAFVGEPTVPVYSATKGGLTALCRSLATRHGPEGIRCVTICPGDVTTRMLEDYLARDPDPVAARSAMEARYPLGRLIEPEDIGRLAVFLASDHARCITGTDVIIDAGLTARCY